MLKEAFQIMKTGHTSTLKTILVEYYDCDLERNGTSGKELACHCRRSKRFRFDPWVWKIPWRRKWQHTLVFLPGESQGQRSLAGYSPQRLKDSDMNEAT